MRPPRPTKHKVPQPPPAQRSLTPLEACYVQGKLRAQQVGRQAILFFSALFVVLGVGCYAMLMSEGMSDPTGILLLMALGLLLVVAGAALFYTGYRRRFTADAHTTELVGLMTEQVVHVANPRTGVRQTVRSYHVNGILLLLPFGGDHACRQVLNQPVRAVTALIHKSNPIDGLGEGSWLHERASEAVLLELGEHLHIDHVLSTYGPRYFHRRVLREVVVFGMAFSLAFLPMSWLVWQNVHSPAAQTLTSWTGIALTMLGCVLLALLFGWAYDVIERRLAPFPDQLSHEERLRKPRCPPARSTPGAA